MPITCWVNKLSKLGVYVLLCFANLSFTTGEVELMPAHGREGILRLPMTDGSDYTVASFPDRDAVFYDKNKHSIRGTEFVSLFRLSPSNPKSPTGFCGAGSEVWLHVYRVSGGTLTEVTTTQVSSCLHSISLASQNSGAATQDVDFSSVRWSDRGFSVDWFERVDAAGDSLKRSEFFLHEGVFLQQDVINKTGRHGPTNDQ
jgi:hypothetical protein